MVSLASVFSLLYRDPPKTADDTHSAENTSNVFAFCNPTQSIFYVIICNEYLSIILTFDMFWQLDPATGRWTTKKSVVSCLSLFRARLTFLCAGRFSPHAASNYVARSVRTKASQQSVCTCCILYQAGSRRKDTESSRYLQKSEV